MNLGHLGSLAAEGVCIGCKLPQSSWAFREFKNSARELIRLTTVRYTTNYIVLTVHCAIQCTLYTVQCV